MPADVETMMSANGQVPWHGLGTIVQEAPTSKDALRLAGLDWKVSKVPIQTDDGARVPSWYATVRDTDKKVLGLVSEKYRVVQNEEAFAFTDSLVGFGARYETAGALKGGRRVWMQAILGDNWKIAGDETVPYLCFTNSHDGSSSVRVILTPVRVVCQNTLSLALRGAKRMWSAIHVGSMNKKLEAAQKALKVAETYMKRLDEEADLLAHTKIDLDAYIATLLPITENMGERAMLNTKENRDTLRTMCRVDNLIPFDGTAWQFLQGVIDYRTHTEPKRDTPTFYERRFEQILDGDAFVFEAHKMVAKEAQRQHGNRTLVTV